MDIFPFVVLIKRNYLMMILLETQKIQVLECRLLVMVEELVIGYLEYLIMASPFLLLY
jgi:hypothetical protein